ncbi:MAG: S41 family peptidase, partial [Marinicella sp.]
LTINASENNVALSQEQVKQSIVDTLETLNEVYVFPEQAKEIEDVIIGRMNKGAYDHITTREEFARIITGELKEVSTDRHLSIMVVKDKNIEPTHILVETEDMNKNNYGFQKLEVLRGNVAYLKFNKFYMDNEAIETVDHAFGFLKGTDAMIIDLRDCIGGSPELARYMLSQFFNEQVLLWRIHSRGDKQVFDHYSVEEAGQSRFKNKYPLYILVGSGTASAAEMFAYTLKHYSRATIIGEKTRGVAHAVSAVKINEYFNGRFSMSRPVNPITNSNWEIVGVLPDIKSGSDESFNVAHNLALETLNKQ